MKKNSWRSTKMARIEENQETFLKIYNQSGETFKKRRKQKGWTQRQLCNAMKNIFPDISVTQSDVSEWEHECEYENAIVHPRAYKILCMAFTLGMHPSEIYSIKGTRKPFSPQLYESLNSEEKFKHKLGKKLKSIMIEKGFSNSSLAASFYKEANKMGILISADFDSIIKDIQRYRNGRRNLPLYYLILLCKVLDVEISDFLS